jgi:hypothetical protein
MYDCFKCTSKAKFWVVDDRGIPKVNYQSCAKHVGLAVKHVLTDRVVMSARVFPYRMDDE